MTRLLASLLYIILIILIWIMLPVLLLRWQRRERETLFSQAEPELHRDIMAYVIGEMKIDQYLLELESR